MHLSELWLLSLDTLERIRVELAGSPPRHPESRDWDRRSSIKLLEEIIAKKRAGWLSYYREEGYRDAFGLWN